MLYRHRPNLFSMTDVPDIPLDQIQQRVVAMWMGSFHGSRGYVARKLGKRGLREFQDLGARQVAATFKRIGITTPAEVALAVATNEKNLFGSIVEIKEAEGSAEIRRNRCALLEGARTFSRLGATMLAKEHCETCRESHWRKVFSELGMTMETEETEDGCVMLIR